MTYLLNTKLADAVKKYDLSRDNDISPVSCSEEFKTKMERLIRRKKNNYNARKVILRLSAAVLVVAIFASWMYLMVIQQNPEIDAFYPGGEDSIGNPAVASRPEDDTNSENSDVYLISIEDYYGLVSQAIELIYEDEVYYYYLSTIRSEFIMLTFSDNTRISLKDALDSEMVKIQELYDMGLSITIEPKPGYNIMTGAAIIYSLIDFGFCYIEIDRSTIGESFLSVSQKPIYIGDEHLNYEPVNDELLEQFEIITIYQYFSIEAMETDASYIDKSGFSINPPGKGINISWVSYPHWFKSGLVIVQYTGENQRILDFLRSNLEYFAGYELTEGFLNNEDNFTFPAVSFEAAVAMIRADLTTLSSLVIDMAVLESTIPYLVDFYDEIELMETTWSPENIISPTEIYASHKYLIKGEDSFGYVSMILVKVDDEWKVNEIYFEK